MPLYEKDIEKIKDLESEQEESESSEEKISSSSESEEEDIMKKYLKSDDPM